ncbi:metal ABC transporter solute-binding protein, Zn/Mn family [Thalassospira marina]|uniref:ABC transporter substrate-binding protein n=1 Tax=Thalassospira marina TaxID=2048283 RepID=A0ABM6QB24_9PROT|nr:zinc ABC transporter substrate-binding protein [Thalassospira marina]AUG53743.1 ABC transporter substrate-binding protein [Thalassospira marina]
MKHPHLLRTALVSSLMLFTAGAASAKTLNVVTSFSILADVVENVGGDHVKVTNLVGADGDPHDYEPAPQDAIAIHNADVTFLSGEGLEGWFARITKAANGAKAPVVVSDGIKTHEFEEDGEKTTDPHVWNSVANVMIWVDNIKKALIAADPEDAAYFNKNAADYSTVLQALDDNIRHQIAQTPKSARKILTSHDAFGYYGQAYGVSFLSPLGVSTESEASAKDVADLISQIKSENVHIYFLENSNDSRLVRQIAKATGANPGGELYPESLSDSSGPAPTYVELMKYNTALMVQAMNGSTQ